jgi:hypothetical protein
VKYQLASVLAQVKHLKKVQVSEQGLVQEWVFPLEKALERALEELQGVGAEELSLARVEEQAEVWESGQLQDWHRSLSQSQLPLMYEQQEQVEE